MHHRAAADPSLDQSDRCRRSPLSIVSAHADRPRPPAIPADLIGTVSYVAPQPQYTPPVIYSESTRAKLVYLIEARPMPEQAAPIVKRLREERPGLDFTISLRAAWDGRDEAALTARLEGFAAVGVGHVMVEPFDRELDDWLRSVERIARAGEGVRG